MRRKHSDIVAFLALYPALLLAVPARGQSESATAGGANSAQSSRMLLPPPVSGEAYPATVSSEVRSNFLGVGANFSGGYIRNLYPGTGLASVNDTTYLIQPHISLDQESSRYHETLTYSPSFTYYHPNSTLNNINQSAAAELQLRLSPHVSLEALDGFDKTSNAFVQASSLSEGTVYGSAPSVTPGIVAPFAPQWTNNANVGISWQFGASSMIGASGTLTKLNFTDSSDEARGFYDSNSRGGAGFYTHRFTDRQYLGALYQYSWIHATPSKASAVASGVVQSHTMLGFYTLYLSQQLSISLAGGYQSYTMMQAPLPAFQSWAPAGTISLGWQGLHTSFAGSYSRIVTAGEGVVGAFESDSANTSARWRLSRTWTAGIAGGYSDITNVAPKQFLSSTAGGHTISGNASLQYRISSNLGFSCGYSRLHQTYAGIPAISDDPNTDQVLVSLDYRLSRGLGR